MSLPRSRPTWTSAGTEEWTLALTSNAPYRYVVGKAYSRASLSPGLARSGPLLARAACWTALLQ